jgi:hypothetical protein
LTEALEVVHLALSRCSNDSNRSRCRLSAWQHFNVSAPATTDPLDTWRILNAWRRGPEAYVPHTANNEAAERFTPLLRRQTRICSIASEVKIQRNSAQKTVSHSHR